MSAPPPAVDQIHLEDTSVLIVTDDPTLATRYRGRLESTGCLVSVATDRDQGLSRARQLQPEVIFLDLQMQSGTGSDFLRELRGTPETAELPVIIIKGSRAADEPP